MNQIKYGLPKEKPGVLRTMILFVDIVKIAVIVIAITPFVLIEIIRSYESRPGSC